MRLSVGLCFDYTHARRAVESEPQGSAIRSYTVSTEPMLRNAQRCVECSLSMLSMR